MFVSDEWLLSGETGYRADVDDQREEGDDADDENDGLGERDDSRDIGKMDEVDEVMGR